MTWQLLSPRASDLRESKEAVMLLVSEVMHCHLLHMLFVRTRSLSPTHTQGVENRPSLSNVGVFKNVWTCWKTTTGGMSVCAYYLLSLSCVTTEGAGMTLKRWDVSQECLRERRRNCNKMRLSAGGVTVSHRGCLGQGRSLGNGTERRQWVSSRGT